VTENESRWQPKKGFSRLPIGDQKWVLIAIQEILIIRWQPKMGFGHHSKNFNRWMVVENRFRLPSNKSYSLDDDGKFSIASN
jgi:hypothetical protein